MLDFSFLNSLQQQSEQVLRVKTKLVFKCLLVYFGAYSGVQKSILKIWDFGFHLNLKN